MYDISVIIASISDDAEALKVVIDSILRPNCPYKCKVRLVSQLEHFENENVVCIKEDNPTGSCEAYNNGLKFADTNYIAIDTDDIIFKDQWWEFIPMINNSIVSLKTGRLMDSPIPHIFALDKAFLANNVMQGFLFNPAMTHMYIDCDLGFRLTKNGVPLQSYEVFGGLHTNNEDIKTVSKIRSYRLDGMVFNHIWKNRYPDLFSVTPLFPESYSSDEELSKRMAELLKKDISGEVYEV